MRTLNREGLAKVIHEVLDVPVKKSIRSEKEIGTKVVNAIITSIESALLRGEDVKIEGFGIFRIRTRPPRKNLAYYFYGLKCKGLHKEVITLPAKTYVYFQPSKVLSRMINGN